MRLLALTGQPRPLGVRLGLLDQGDAAGLGLLLGLVAGGVGGLADLRVQLAVGQSGLPLGDLLLLGEDLLRPLGLGQRTAAAARAAASSVSALISACFSANVRWATAISSSAFSRACSAARRATASAMSASCLARAASGRPRSSG